MTGSTVPGDDVSYKWWIPITYSTIGENNGADTTLKHWLTPTEDLYISGLPSANEYVIFNNLQTGYYRVNYDENNWVAIINQLSRDHTAIEVINRAQLLDDSLNLARAGKQTSYPGAISDTW